MSNPIRPAGVDASWMRGIAEIPDTKSTSSFTDLFKNAVNETQGLQTDARQTIEAFLRGEPVELHQVMAASEEAAISLELLVQIRNKLTDAYRAIMNVQ